MQKNLESTYCFSPHTWGCPFWTIFWWLILNVHCFSPHTWGCPFWTRAGACEGGALVSVPILGDVPSGPKLVLLDTHLKCFSPHTWGCPFWTQKKHPNSGPRKVSVPILGDVPSGQYSMLSASIKELFQSPYLGMSLLDSDCLFAYLRGKVSVPILGDVPSGQSSIYCSSKKVSVPILGDVPSGLSKWVGKLLSTLCFSPHTWGCPFWTMYESNLKIRYLVSVPILGDVPSGPLASIMLKRMRVYKQKIQNPPNFNQIIWNFKGGSEY